MTRDLIGHATLDVMEGAKKYNAWILNIIRPFLKNPIAEVGSGTGTFTRRLSDLGYEVVALDYNPEYIKLTEKITKSFQLNLQSNVLPIGLSSRFNSAIALNVLEHLSRDYQAVRNVYSMLKSGGIFVVLVPAHMFAYGTLDKNLGHVRRYTQASLSNLLAPAGFRIISCKYFNFLGILGWWLSSRIFKKQTISKWQITFFEKVSGPILKLESWIRPPIGLSVLCIAQKP